MEVGAAAGAPADRTTGGLRWGVEPVCHVLEIAPSTYYGAKNRPPSARAIRDADLGPRLVGLWEKNYSVYGRRKLAKAARRAGIDAGRDQVARLMRAHGMRGSTRAKKWRTTKPDPVAARAPDLVNRRFTAAGPDQLWVADFTYCSTWSGVIYLAFVVDVFSRRIVGWRAATTMTTELVLDTLEMAIWARARDGVSDLVGLVHHTDAGSQYTSFAFTERLIEAGVDPSVGSVGDAYDNALAESQIGAYKTELIRPEGPWRDVEHVELETLHWVDWFNTERPHESIDDLTPIQAEEVHYAARNRLVPTG